MNRKAERNLAILIVLMGSLVALVSFSIYYNTIINIAYTRDFGYNIQIAQMASTFENLRASVVRVNDTIKLLFPGDQSRMYATILPWNKTPDHTLMMQTNMINLYAQRIDVSISYYDSYKQNATAALVNDWYTTTLQNVKTKWDNDGGFNLLWSVYTIQKFGVIGNMALNVIPWIIIILFFLALIFSLYFGNTDMKSEYKITYTSGVSTQIYETEAITVRGALKDFRDRRSYNKIVSVAKVLDAERDRQRY